MKQLHFIVTYQKKAAPDIFLHLAHSLCPTILGHEMVKLGLVLSLLGGASSHCPQSSDENSSAASNAPPVQNAVATRSNAHVLLVGDPGLGKSQLLRAAAAAAPHGHFVNSMSSTAAGLTVSVSKDVITNDMALEAGALALADNGVCCIDELDNMKIEHKTLLEVMEQQEVRSAL